MNPLDFLVEKLVGIYKGLRPIDTQTQNGWQFQDGIATLIIIRESDQPSYQVIVKCLDTPQIITYKDEFGEERAQKLFGDKKEATVDSTLVIKVRDNDKYVPYFEAYFYKGKHQVGIKYDRTSHKTPYKTVYGLMEFVRGDLFVEWGKFESLFANLPPRYKQSLKPSA